MMNNQANMFYNFEKQNHYYIKYFTVKFAEIKITKHYFA